MEIGPLCTNNMVETSHGTFLAKFDRLPNWRILGIFDFGSSYSNIKYEACMMAEPVFMNRIQA